MKKIILSLSLLISMSTFATVRTVSSNPSTIAQFNNLQTAINAAFDGDTIYVHGSPNAYPAVTIQDKYLILIGPGRNPDKNLPLTAEIVGLTLDNSAFTGSPSGTELHGLDISSTLNLSNNNAINNLKIIRCKMTGVLFSRSSSNCLFESNYFFNTINFSGSETYTNFVFQNNVYNINSCCVSYFMGGLVNTVNILFDHNIFVSNSPAYNFASTSRFLTFSNNIFINSNPASGVSFSSYNNNITYGCGPIGDTAWIRNSNVDNGGNKAGQNPQMVDQTAANTGSVGPLNNFTIASGPANNAGSDGKDIGLLYDAVGSLNWTNSRTARLPRIYNLNITTPTVAPGGNLNVNVDARVSN
jgi:hypothetical protein